MGAVLGIALLLLVSAQPGSAAPEPAAPEPAAQPGGDALRLLGIRLVPYSNGACRVVLQLTGIPTYLVLPAEAGQPLVLELAGVSVDPGLQPTPAANALLRGVKILPEIGKLRLEFDLAVPRVRAKALDLPAEGILMLDLEPPGSPAASADSSPAAPPAEPAVPALPAVSAGPAPAVPAPEAIPSVPPPGVSVGGAARSTRPLEAGSAPSEPLVPVALPGIDAAGIAVSSGTTAGSADGGQVPPPSRADGPPEEDPLEHVALQFPRADEMEAARKAGDYQKALQIGLDGLAAPQPRSSLESLLYLLADCRFGLELARMAPASPYAPDWYAALNLYEQAMRFAPGSPFRPYAQFRLAEIYGYMGRLEEKRAQLKTVWRENRYPRMTEALRQLGETCLILQRYSPGTQELLTDAQQAFEEALRRDPQGAESGLAQLLLGETYYRQGQDAQAYDAVFKVLSENRNQKIQGYREVYEHFALAAHRIGKLNLIAPQSENDRTFVRQVMEQSPNPETRLAYARLLEQGGVRREAMKQYYAVRRFLANVSPEQMFEARLALTRFALEDAEKNQIDPNLYYEDYVHPVETLKELYEQSFDLRRRMDLLQYLVRHLIARGREVEAIRLVLPFLRQDRLPPALASELSRSIWDILPQAIRYFKEQGDYLFALQVYENFGSLLDQHPAKDELVLECARILLDADLRDNARKALERLSPYPSLSPSQQAQVTLLKREMNLDPSDPERLKREAPVLLQPDYDDFVRARVLRMLAKVYADEGKHAYAAGLYLQGKDLKNLPWRDRMAFYEKAVAEYEAVPDVAKELDVAWQAIRDFESTGVPLAQAQEEAGSFLLVLGEKFAQMQDPVKAAKAYEQYLLHFPDSPAAPSARFFLADAYADQQDIPRALEILDRLAADTARDAFWADSARKTAEHLRWEQQHPYLQKEAPRP